MIQPILTSFFRIFLILPETWNFIAPLTGAFIGVVGGFLVQLLIISIRTQRQKEDEKRRKKYFLEILAKEIEHNISLLKLFHNEISVQSKDFFDYNLSTTSKEAIWSELIKLEGDSQFVNKLNKIYYDYNYVNRKLDFQLNSAFKSGVISEVRRGVLRSILDLKVTITQESENILNEIREKLNSLL